MSKRHLIALAAVPLIVGSASAQTTDRSHVAGRFVQELDMKSNVAVLRADKKLAVGAKWLAASNGNTPAGLQVEQMPSGLEDNVRKIPVCRVSGSFRNWIGGPRYAGTHPGKLADGGCYSTYAGKESRQSAYEVLSMPAGSFKWERWRGVVPPEAVLGGVEDAQEGGTRKLYVCRAAMGNPNIVHTGKIHEHKCFIGWNGREEKMADFEVLLHTGEGVTAAGSDLVRAAGTAMQKTTPGQAALAKQEAQPPKPLPPSTRASRPSKRSSPSQTPPKGGVRRPVTVQPSKRSAPASSGVVIKPAS